MERNQIRISVYALACGRVNLIPYRYIFVQELFLTISLDYRVPVTNIIHHKKERCNVFNTRYVLEYRVPVSFRSIRRYNLTSCRYSLQIFKISSVLVVLYLQYTCTRKISNAKQNIIKMAENRSSCRIFRDMNLQGLTLLRSTMLSFA